MECGLGGDSFVIPKDDQFFTAHKKELSIEQAFPQEVSFHFHRQSHHYFSKAFNTVSSTPLSVSGVLVMAPIRYKTFPSTREWMTGSPA